MRLISYLLDGRPGFGALVGDGVVRLEAVWHQAGSLRSALEHVPLSDVARYVETRAATVPVGVVTLLPVIPDPGKILCVGLNYESHRTETRRPQTAYPTIFTRFADTQVAHGQSLIKPVESEAFDFEAELAVVIGRGGRYIDPDDAMGHVAGYACYNDASVRDWQRHTSQFTPGKNFPSTGGFGPALVTVDAVPDLADLRIIGRLNGEVMQDASLDQMIFSIPELIAYCSRFTSLAPGDVIVTGTPGGIGDRREPPVYLKVGDRFEVDIGEIGTLSNPVS